MILKRGSRGVEVVELRDTLVRLGLLESINSAVEQDLLTKK